MDIAIERIETSGLRRQVWHFTALTSYGPGPLELRLDRWAAEERATKRHKWATTRQEGYQRRSHNGVVHYGGRRLPAAEVPFPDDVITEAKAALLARVAVIGPADPPQEAKRA